MTGEVELKKGRARGPFFITLRVLKFTLGLFFIIYLWLNSCKWQESYSKVGGYVPGGALPHKAQGLYYFAPTELIISLLISGILLSFYLLCKRRLSFFRSDKLAFILVYSLIWAILLSYLNFIELQNVLSYLCISLIYWGLAILLNRSHLRARFMGGRRARIHLNRYLVLVTFIGICYTVLMTGHPCR